MTTDFVLVREASGRSIKWLVTGKAMLDWARRRGVVLRLLKPGKPNQNAYVNSFNGRSHSKCLNEH